MPLARLILVLVAAVALATPAAGAAEAKPLDLSAKRVADAYVRALVVRHDPDAAAAFTRARIGELRRLSARFERDGVGKVIGQSRILRGCKTAASDKPSPRGDCVRFRVRGSRRVGRGERLTDGDLRIWLRQEAGRWKVWAYDYSAEVTDCPGVCK